MKTIEYAIEIDASRKRVWKSLWEDATFREWSSIIDEGTYMKGLMKEGKEVEFISSVSGYGVTSLVEKLQPKEFVSFRHRIDTKDSGREAREKEWTGGVESYTLAENNGKVTLTVKTDVPKEQESLFNVRFPKALERIKALAENGFLFELSAPARGALVYKGIDSIEKLSQYTEKEILKIHGIGPASIPTMKALLEAKDLAFKNE